MDSTAGLKIIIDTKDALTAKDRLDKLDTSVNKLDKSSSKLSSVTSALNLQNIVILGTITKLATESIKLADTYTNMQSRLRLVTKNSTELAQVQDKLFESSQRTRTSYEGNVELYTRLAQATAPLKLGQERLLAITETINKAGIISGGSAEGIKAALIQLGQGLSAGALRGEELNSVLEQMPRLAKVISDSMGVEVGALKSLAEQGLITNQVVVKALESEAKTIDKEFGKMQMTVSQAMTTIGNSMLDFVGKADKATGASATLSNFLKSLSSDIDGMLGSFTADEIKTFYVESKAYLGAFADGVNYVYEVLENSAQGIVYGLNSTVYGALEVLAKMALETTKILNNVGMSSDDTLKKTQSFYNTILNQRINANKGLSDSIKEVVEAQKKASVSVSDRIKIGYAEVNLAKTTQKLNEKQQKQAEAKALKTAQQVKKEMEAKEKAKKQEEDFIKFKKQIEAQISIAQTDDTLKPFKALEEAYKLDLDKWKDSEEAKALITKKYLLDKKELERKAFDDYSDLMSKKAEDELDKEIKLQEKIIEEREKSDNKKLEIGKTKFDTLTMDVDDSNISQLENKLVDLSDTYMEQLNSIEDKNGEAAQKLSVDYLSSVKTITDEMEKIKDIDINVNVKGFDDISNGIAGLVNGFSDLQKIAKDHEKQTKRLVKGSDEYNKVSLNTASNQIGAYANMTGAMSSFFTKNEQANKKLMELQRVMFAAQMAIELQKQFAYGTTAMAASLTLPPPASFAAYAATGAMLASLGIMVGGALKGSDKVSSSYDSLSAMKANDGSGTVLGDMLKGSDSIVNSLEILSDLAKPEHELIANMNKSLISIDNKIGGVTTMLLRNAGYALGEGYTGFNTGFSNNVGINSNLAGYGGAMALGTAGMYSGFIGGGAGTLSLAGGASAALPMVAGALIADKLLLDGAITGAISSAVGSIVGGLFGKSSTSQALTDSGLIFANQLITQAMDDFYGSAYQTIATTTSKKSWFSSSSSTSYATYTQAMDEEISNQFELILGGMYDSVIGAAEILGMDKQSVIKDLDDFVVELGKISLKGKTGEEMQELLSNVFGKTMDEMVTDALNNTLDGFQKVGETISSTLTRVASGMEEAEYFITRLGYQFEDIDYKDIINQQGEVGVEALKQSLLNYEEAYYQSATGIDEIVNIISGTTEEVYNSFIELDKLRNQISMIGQDVNGITLSMIRGAGGISELSQGMEDYFNNFLTESEKSKFLTESMGREFAKLNLEMPETNDEFKALIQGLDLSTESGQDLFGRLILLSDGFNEMEEAQSGVLDSVKALIDGFESMGDSIQDTIDKLLGVESGSSQTQLITDFWNKKAQAETLLSKGKDLSDEEMDNLQKLISDINSLSTNIQSSTVGSTSNITSNLVSELMLLQGKLPSFAVGTSNVPYDMVAQIHKNETIIPADFATAIRQGQMTLSGGSNSMDNGIIRQELRLMNDKLGKVIAIQDRTLTVQRQQLGILSEA